MVWETVTVRLTDLARRGDLWGLIILAIVLWFLRRRIEGERSLVRVLRRSLALASLLALAYALLLVAGILFRVDVAAPVRAGGRLLLVIVLAYAGWELTDILGGYIIGRIPRRDEFHERRLETVRNLTRWAGRVIILFVAVTMILDIFEVNITPLVASASVVGLAIGLGSQKLMQDIIAGLFILIEDQFHVGDSVEVAGVAGSVEDMTLRVTKVRDFHGVLHFIPNSEIGRVANRTRVWARAIAEVGVAYDSNLGRVEEVLKQVGEDLYKENPDGIFLEAPFPLGPEELGDSAIAFKLVAKVKPGKQWDAQRIMRRRIKEAFDAAGIVIPFPQVDVHLAQES